MLLETSDYRPPFWLFNGHLQTIYPSLRRKVTIDYHHQRLETDDNDFLDLYWSFANQKSNKLLILSHGLEGDASRQYITGMIRLFNARGYDCLAWNYRSCGTTMNRQLRTYHSGETSDLQRVIDESQRKNYSKIYLAGFSLGGNITLKYLGEQSGNIAKNIKKAVVFSVPMDLEACSRHISKAQNWLYSKRFLNTLKPKIMAKAQQFPHKIDATKWAKIKTIYDFDEFFTGPIHGFKNAHDYYTQSSSKHFIEHIKIPTLIVNAKNDPLVSYQSLPIEIAKNLDFVTLELTKAGGHCGFLPNKIDKNGVYWSENRAFRFIES